MQIRGTSIINHRIRAKLKLSLAEYCVMQFLFDWVKKEPPKYNDFYCELGIDNKTLNTIVIKLQNDKFLENLKTTTKWNINFTDNSGEFEKLWLLLPKGNKTKAKQRYIKVIKTIEHAELEAKLRAYIAYCDRCQVLKKGIDVWLNPVLAHWNDSLYVDKAMKPKLEEPKGIKFFMDK